eukprot:IDg9006t1
MFTFCTWLVHAVKGWRQRAAKTKPLGFPFSRSLFAPSGLRSRTAQNKRGFSGLPENNSTLPLVSFSTRDQLAPLPFRFECEQQQLQMMQAIFHKHQAYFNGTAASSQKGTTTGARRNGSDDESSRGQDSSNDCEDREI